MSFWNRWLIVVTVLTLLFASGFILVPDVMQSLFNWMFFAGARSNASFSAEATRYLIFTYGVLGAVMVGWAVALLGIITGPFRRGERWAWDTLAASTTIWFVVDTAFSLSMGFVENAIFNGLFFVLFAIPLAATYRPFHA